MIVGEPFPGVNPLGIDTVSISEKGLLSHRATLQTHYHLGNGADTYTVVWP